MAGTQGVEYGSGLIMVGPLGQPKFGLHDEGGNTAVEKQLGSTRLLDRLHGQHRAGRVGIC